MTFRKPTFLPFLSRIWWCSMFQRSSISSTVCLLKRWAIWGWATYPPAQQAMQRLLQLNPAHDKAHLIRHALQSGMFS